MNPVDGVTGTQEQERGLSNRFYKLCETVKHVAKAAFSFLGFVLSFSLWKNGWRSAKSSFRLAGENFSQVFSKNRAKVAGEENPEKSGGIQKREQWELDLSTVNVALRENPNSEILLSKGFYSRKISAENFKGFLTAFKKLQNSGDNLEKKIEAFQMPLLALYDFVHKANSIGSADKLTLQNAGFLDDEEKLCKDYPIIALYILQKSEDNKITIDSRAYTIPEEEEEEFFTHEEDKEKKLKLGELNRESRQVRETEEELNRHQQYIKCLADEARKKREQSGKGEEDLGSITANTTS